MTPKSVYSAIEARIFGGKAMLNSRLRAIIRGTKRGAAYSDRALNNAIKVFSNDILEYISIELLNEMSDSVLLSNYLTWEVIAVKVTDPEQRLKQVRKNLRVSLLSSVAQPESHMLPSNIVSLFSKTIS